MYDVCMNTVQNQTAAQSTETTPTAAEVLDAIERRAVNDATRALMDGRVVLSVPYDALSDSACDWCRKRLGVQVIGNHDSVSLESAGASDDCARLTID